ncbi:uncharacterized protein [Procambarus clarkii]|uniref:uncharacterized protein n=1 Tax=Procambarus clarkii TaxID=6728 RepID=UPI0037444A26
MHLNIGTLNVGGLNTQKKQKLLLTFIEERNLDIMFIQEHHLKEDGNVRFTSDDYHVYMSYLPKQDSDKQDKGAGDKGAGGKGAGGKGAGDEGAGDKGAGDEGAGGKSAGDKGAGDEGAGGKDAGDEGAGGKGAGDKGAGDEGAGDKGAGDEGAGGKGAGDEGAGDKGAGGKDAGDKYAGGEGEEGKGAKRKCAGDKGGTGILIRKALDFKEIPREKAIHCDKDDEARTFILYCTINNCELCLVSVYAHSGTNKANLREAFFKNLPSCIDKKNDRIIMAGDWNCITDKEDSNNPTPQNVSKELPDIMKILNMEDAWKMKRAKPVFTYPDRKRRLDRIYIPKEKCKVAKIEAVSFAFKPSSKPHSDHKAVLMELIMTSDDNMESEEVGAKMSPQQLQSELLSNDEIKQRVFNQFNDRVILNACNVWNFVFNLKKGLSNQDWAKDGQVEDALKAILKRMDNNDNV